MIKIYSIIFLCAIFHLANAQSVIFPEVKKGEHKYVIETDEHWQPTAQFKRENPDILTRAVFSISKNKYWNSNAYPAVLCRNNINIMAPGRIFVLFNGDEMPDLDGSENETHPNGMDFIPLYSDESCQSWKLGTKIYSNQGLYNIDIKFQYGKFLDVQDKYISLNNAYKGAVSRAFGGHKFANYTMLPLASFNLAKEDINAADLFFEFSIDGVWSNVKGKEKEVRGKTYDYGCFYKLAIRDCSGKILKTYGQSVFSSFLCYINFWSNEVDFQNALFFGCTYSAAIECLLSQYAADNEIKKEIIKRTTALKIQTYSDKSIIKLFKLKSEANYFRHCQMNVIYGLNELNRDIKMLGGDGLDLSGIKMPENSSPKVISQTQFDQGSAIVAGAAELSALIINQSEKAKVRNFRDEAEKYKSTFDGFVESEEKVVAQYNSLLQTAKTTDISQIGNPGQINSTNQNQQGAQVSPNTDLEHYWDEGKPAANNGRNKQTSNGQANYSNSNQSTQSQAPQSSQNTQPQVSQSGADFWDDAGTATASTPAKGNQKNTGKSLKPISTSSDLQSNFDKADQSLSQSTANSLNKINSVEKGNSGWANASFDKYKADIEAVTASKSNGNNGKGGAQNGNGCTQANNDPSLKARVQNCQSQACILQCEADLIKLNLQDCPDQFSPEDTQKMQTMINTLENEIRSMR